MSRPSGSGAAIDRRNRANMGADQPTPPTAVPTTSRSSILALDGGGARGYLSVKILEHVEAHLNALTGQNLPLGARFDLIAGTSTGGIAALALALGLAAHEVSALYETYIPQIFGSAMRRFRWTDYFRPRYRTAALRRALQVFFRGAHTRRRADRCLRHGRLARQRPAARVPQRLCQERNFAQRRDPGGPGHGDLRRPDLLRGAFHQASDRSRRR